MDWTDNWLGSPADGNSRHGRSVVIVFSEPFAPGVTVRTQTAPHFLLLTQIQSNPTSIIGHQPLSGGFRSDAGGIWRFVLEEIDGDQRIEVSETEPGVWGERLQLLAVVRGLEALEQPSRVTLITPSRFVGIGIRSNLSQWRENGWRWEHYGEMIPIKNVDLWKRIDQALRFHQLDCRIWNFDSAEPRSESREPTDRRHNRFSRSELLSGRASRVAQPLPKSPTIRIKPLGSGRAFGLYDPSALSTVSFTG